MRNKVAKFKPKSKEMIREASDIILNTEDDSAAIAFLQDTLEDDFPDLDLGRMNLHEAISVLDKSQDMKRKSISMRAIEDLNKSLGDFIDYQDKKLEAMNKSKRAKKKTNKSTSKKRVKRK